MIGSAIALLLYLTLSRWMRELAAVLKNKTYRRTLAAESLVGLPVYAAIALICKPSQFGNSSVSLGGRLLLLAVMGIATLFPMALYTWDVKKIPKNSIYIGGSSSLFMSYHFRTKNLKRRNPLNHRIKWHFLPTEVPEEPISHRVSCNIQDPERKHTEQPVLLGQRS